ncbi:MAG: DUF2219 family protein [Rhodobacteraceae bacterium]|nr:DUF2219 family protein [Paracoccaceae bacterium]
MEYRLRSEIIAPSVASGGVDRPYVGALAVGAFTHMGFGPTQLSFGAEALFVGPQTGVSDFQDWYHDVFSLPAPIGTQNQLDNEVFFNAQAEISWPVRISETVTIRPFLAAQSGAEDLVRVGADFVIGSIGHDDFVVRDTVTGQLIRAIEAPQTGFAFVGGFDWAQVGSSAFLPADAGFVALDERLRARAGVHWQVAPDVSVFYGATWLSEEFEGQSEGQLLGSLKLNFNF